MKLKSNYHFDTKINSWSMLSFKIASIFRKNMFFKHTPQNAGCKLILKQVKLSITSSRSAIDNAFYIIKIFTSHRDDPKEIGSIYVKGSYSGCITINTDLSLLMLGLSTYTPIDISIEAEDIRSLDGVIISASLLLDSYTRQRSSLGGSILFIKYEEPQQEAVRSVVYWYITANNELRSNVSSILEFFIQNETWIEEAAKLLDLKDGLQLSCIASNNVNNLSVQDIKRESSLALLDPQGAELLRSTNAKIKALIDLDPCYSMNMEAVSNMKELLPYLIY